MGTHEAEIRQTHATWIAAVNAGDLARLLTLITDDVVLINPGEAPLGRDGFSVRFAAAHRQLRIDCRSELEEVVVVGEVAYTRSRDAVSATPHTGGEAMQFSGDRLTIYRRQRDGRWLLSRDAHTLSAVEAPGS
jgi:uncharacterized protein (TIGR02246 family)